MSDFQRVVGYLIEHPASKVVIDEIAEEYKGQIAMHVVLPATIHDYEEIYDERSPLEVNDLVVKHIDTNEPIAVIKPDGTTLRLDQEDA